MYLNIFKILFIFLLTTSLWSCSADDFDDSVNSGQGLNIETFVFDQAPLGIPNNYAQDSLSSDTLKWFPSCGEFYQRVLDYMGDCQHMVADLARSLMMMSYATDKYNWINFYQSYMGTYISPSDSRVKEWALDYDKELEGDLWPYHLLVTDLPDGNIDGLRNKAVELYYSKDFEEGIMIFSPSHFNAVGYPANSIGHNTRGKLYFKNSHKHIDNVLYITNYGDRLKPGDFQNLFLSIKWSDDNLYIVQALVDCPCLWFDEVSNAGYTIALAGAINVRDGLSVFNAGICRNNVETIGITPLVSGHNIEKELPLAYGKWTEMMNLGQASDDKAPSYKSPAYFQNGRCVESGVDIKDKSMYQSILGKMDLLLGQDYPLSPYKNFVNQIEW